MQCLVRENLAIPYNEAYTDLGAWPGAVRDLCFAGSLPLKRVVLPQFGVFMVGKRPVACFVQVREGSATWRR